MEAVLFSGACVYTKLYSNISEIIIFSSTAIRISDFTDSKNIQQKDQRNLVGADIPEIPLSPLSK
jgi:hypothetical protein